MGHTPGPWYANQDCIEIDGPEGPRDVTLAVVLQPDNAAADARLIAAAPELLAALQEAVTALNVKEKFPVYDTDSYAISARCDKAIAKAEGRSE